MSTGPEPASQLTVTTPDGVALRPVGLTGRRITIGRLSELNDLALEPDPQRVVTRQAHCLLERTDGRWAVVDNASVNGTFLRRGDAFERVQGRALLVDGDVICILAELHEDAAPAYWQLAFTDRLVGGQEIVETERGLGYRVRGR